MKTEVSVFGFQFGVIRDLRAASHDGIAGNDKSLAANHSEATTELGSAHARPVGGTCAGKYETGGGERRAGRGGEKHAAGENRKTQHHASIKHETERTQRSKCRPDAKFSGAIEFGTMSRGQSHRNLRWWPPVP